MAPHLRFILFCALSRAKGMVINMIFLGTGAAEMYPDPFCACERCERVRLDGETLLADIYTCIDFGPDVLAASQQYNAPLYDLRNIFITHTQRPPQTKI